MNSTKSPSSAYGTKFASASFKNAAFVRAKSWLGQFATRSIAMADRRVCAAVKYFSTVHGFSTRGAFFFLVDLSKDSRNDWLNYMTVDLASGESETGRFSSDKRVQKQVCSKPVGAFRLRHPLSTMAPTMLSTNVHAASVVTRSAVNGNSAVSGRYGSGSGDTNRISFIHVDACLCETTSASNASMSFMITLHRPIDHLTDLLTLYTGCHEQERHHDSSVPHQGLRESTGHIARRGFD